MAGPSDHRKAIARRWPIADCVTRELGFFGTGNRRPDPLNEGVCGILRGRIRIFGTETGACQQHAIRPLPDMQPGQQDIALDQPGQWLCLREQTAWRRHRQRDAERPDNPWRFSAGRNRK